MPVLFFSEFRPDVSDYEGNSSKNITNVIPRGDGYGPFQAFSAFSGALPAACAGAFAARKSDGSMSIFAGTSTKLYMLSNINGQWTDVSRGGGTYSALSTGITGAIWRFAQFNNFVFATQANDNLQIFDLTSSTAFADRADSNCPAAAYITVVNSFLVLSGLSGAGLAYRVHWSGLNDVSTSSAFTPGINSSDFQDLADGGLVRGVSGGEYGVIFQDTSLRRLLYSPGSPYVFQIDRIAVDDGLLTPYSLIQSGNNVFWVGPFGFKMLAPGGLPTPIGKERVDRFFQASCDFTRPDLLQGANDPTHTRVMWAYKTSGNSQSTADRMLIYDWALDRWSTINGGGFTGVAGITPLAPTSVSLEGTDSAFGTGTPVRITALTTPASGSVFTADQGANAFTAGMGVILTVSATTTTTLPAAVAPATPYYVTASNLTTSAFSLTTSGGIGTAITTSGSTSAALATTTFITMAATAGTSALYYAREPIEGLNLGSFDNIASVSQISLAAISTSYTLGFFAGSPIEATLETPEQGGDGKRIFNRGFRVVTDATSGSVMGSASYRESPQAAYNYTAEDAIDERGQVSLRLSTRYTRNKIRIPSATSWTFVAGVEADNVPEGIR